jgi:hypothetical protein
MKLYLDDRRSAPALEGYVSADNYADFLALVDKYRRCIELVDLDFDLGWDSRFSGLDALRYMKKHDIKPDHINVHSTHISGRDMMLRFAIANFPDSIVTGWESGV